MLTLDANGRPTYTKSAPKGGRMLRENSINSQLPRIPSSSSNYHPMKPGQMRQSSSASSGNDLNIEIVKLRTHVASLEKENSKLKSQVAQGEKSISNYRSFLSKMTPNDDKSDIGCQTDNYKDETDINNNNSTNKELTKQINLVNKLTEKEKTLNNEMNKLQDDKDKLNNSLNNKQKENDELNKKLSIITTESNKNQKDNENQENKNKNNMKLISSQVSNMISKYKSNSSSNMNEIKSSLLDFNNFLLDCITNVTKVTANHKNESSQLLLDKKQLQQDLISKVQELVELNSIKEELDSKQSLLDKMTLSQKTLLSIITSFNEQLPLYGTAYDTEIQSHKKIAHVKDLSRVKEIRELSLEIDKLNDELKHMKEVHNILTFSLATAEQSLNESQPHVVQKLQEGRGKRLKILERTQNERRRDLDQRSSQTITLTSEHLEGFAKKAEKRQLDAENARKLINDKLNEILKSANK